MSFFKFFQTANLAYMETTSAYPISGSGAVIQILGKCSHCDTHVCLLLYIWCLPHGRYLKTCQVNENKMNKWLGSTDELNLLVCVHNSLFPSEEYPFPF
jgi:hypothetical protein